MARRSDHSRPHVLESFFFIYILYFFLCLPSLFLEIFRVGFGNPEVDFVRGLKEVESGFNLYLGVFVCVCVFCVWVVEWVLIWRANKVKSSELIFPNKSQFSFIIIISFFFFYPKHTNINEKVFHLIFLVEFYWWLAGDFLSVFILCCFGAGNLRKTSLISMLFY